MRAWRTGILLASIILAALPGSAGALGPQFDLECEGSYSGGPKRQVDQPFHLRLVVDLSRAVYCNTDCSVVERVYRITPGEIVLESNPAGMTTVVNRRSLAYTSYGALTAGEAPFDTTAVCRAAPFTGIPARSATPPDLR